ncbi:hypothetical protein [Bartonella schoenbuchensis]|uniref:Uncharacterized protein n=1 Tax=Bartonella schoenbuchensis (strain DSM 13525 / NCTC 13165 / R1) TaxID=687861 RepID=A0A1S6XRG9_BARSR|nr:hypothetical protein [Bartonella schoenbuchensis]AQX31220.1 hypothetical protein BscR1v2_013060 [Bartonella schoenbuchensis R1]
MIVKKACGAGLLFFITFTQGIFAQGAGGLYKKKNQLLMQKLGKCL